MKVISWNIGGRTRRAEEQAERLCFQSPDLVGLQEVTGKAYHTVKARLHSYGLEHHIYAREAVASPQKQRCVAVFSRWPLDLLEGHLEVPYPELVLSTKVEHPELPIEFHCVHIPNGSDHGWEKIESFEGVYKGLSMKSDIPRVLCGDFNSPKEELSTGEIIPWRNTDERWANGELSVISGLAEFDLDDVYRKLHGYPPTSFSWYTGNGTGRRFDHIFAPHSLRPNECNYIQGWRLDGLSDHSAIEAVFTSM